MYAPVSINSFEGKSRLFIRSETDLGINKNYHQGLKKIAKYIYMIIEYPAFYFYKQDLKKAIQKAVNKYAGLPEQSIVTDIHLQPNQNSGDLIIFDDEDKELACISIEEWANDDSDDFYEEMQHILQTLLSKLKEEGTFDRLAIMTPYNFVLVDEDKETVAELLIVDDDTLIVNDDLLKGLDEELDTFLKDLLNN